MKTEEEILLLLRVAILQYSNCFTIVSNLIDIEAHISEDPDTLHQYYAARLIEARLFTEMMTLASVLEWDNNTITNAIAQVRNNNA